MEIFKPILLPLFLMATLLFFPKGSLTSKSDFFHNLCLSRSIPSRYKSEILAMTCGKSLPNDSKTKQGLISVGLIHLFVVSGAHLRFYKKWTHILLPGYLGRWLSPIIMIFILLICNLSPPILRASLHSVTGWLNKSCKLNWTENQVTLACGLGTISLVPEYLSSFSLLLSWLATLAILNCKARVKTSAIILTIYPVLLSFGTPHPAMILSSLILSALATALIFPLSLLTYLLPVLSAISDRIFSYFFNVIYFVESNLPYIESSRPLNSPTIVLWVYLFLINLILVYKKPIQLKMKMQ